MDFGSLWWVVILAALAVWIVSAIAWMLLPHHRSDYGKLPDEDAVMDAIRAGGASPGQYMIPHCATMEESKDPAYREKLERGPCGILSLRPPGPMNMAKALVSWMGYALVVSFITAYVARHSLEPGAEFLPVLRMTATIAIAIYALQPIPDAIWMGRPWKVALKTIADGVAYGLVTGLVFALAWPG